MKLNNFDCKFKICVYVMKKVFFLKGAFYFVPFVDKFLNFFSICMYGWCYWGKRLSYTNSNICTLCKKISYLLAFILILKKQ